METRKVIFTECYKTHKCEELKKAIFGRKIISAHEIVSQISNLNIYGRQGNGCGMKLGAF